MTNFPLPKLITFDGEARSGKGTIVQATKDYIRDTLGHKVMLIDGGQVFRVLVVAANRADIDLDDPEAIDAFLQDDTAAEHCVQLVKDVYHMNKTERDSLLYTNEIGRNSAKIGARPLSQAFKDALLRKWLRDARDEGYEIVLFDGRVLEETGTQLEKEGLCDFLMGLYFVCDAYVGARRTLGFAATPYDDPTDEDRHAVNELVDQIKARNELDKNRKVQPIKRPSNAPLFTLPTIPQSIDIYGRFMATIDTSADMDKAQMSQPVCALVSRVINGVK